MRTIEDLSILHWIKNKKTETGAKYDLKSHLFFFDILADFSTVLAIQKPAQVGATTAQILKKFWGIKRYGIDGIYTLPTHADAQLLSKGKITRLQENNPEIKELVKDGDSMGFKRVGDNALYIIGTWQQKSAMMHSSGWNTYDEIDASKQDVIEQMATRLQHSETKWEHYFSHPSTINVGVNRVFEKSDQKHWFIKCERCSKKQFLEWPDSIDIVRKVYICKFCKKPLSDEDRRVGEWVKKHNNRDISGYQLNLLMTVWTPASEIIKYHLEKSEEYFTNKVLGLPYVGAGNKITWDIIQKNITGKFNDQSGKIVIGVDTGLTTWYVVGNQQGIFHYGSCKGYDDVEALLKRYKGSVAVFDQGGDLMKPRELQEKYHGRIFLCHFSVDRKTQELVRWGKDSELGNVVADRNRVIQMVVDEFTAGRIPIYGTESEWHNYFLHWNNMYREEEENALGVPVRKWKRTGDDHWALATAYWRIGMDRFGGGDGTIFSGESLNIKSGVTINPDGTIPADNPLESLEQPYDWRIA